MYGIGFRRHKVFENVTEGVFDRHGAFLRVEVTNNGEAATKFYPNASEDNVSAPQGIPIGAGETRIIPMAVYNFTADDPVTVVGYRQ